MCLILFSYNTHPDYWLILAANRDEFYDRPTSSLHFWDDAKHILAGKDLKSKGTWMGVSRNGRIAAVTNYRDIKSIKENPRSRGLLVSESLAQDKPLKSYLEHIQKTGKEYSGFNFIAGDGINLFWYSNKVPDIRKIKPGIYGLSNHLLDTNWPKVAKGKADLKKLISDNKKFNPEDIFTILADRSIPPDNQLPDTGVGIEWERLLSPVFVKSKVYGTRSSSIILWEHTGRIFFSERRFDLNKTETYKFSYNQFHKNRGRR